LKFFIDELKFSEFFYFLLEADLFFYLIMKSLFDFTAGMIEAFHFEVIFLVKA